MAQDFPALERKLLQELARVQSGIAAELRAQLGVSQPTFSRLLKKVGDEILVTGRASATRYAARRNAQDLPDRLPIYEVGEEGRSRRVAVLHAVLPEGYYVETQSSDIVPAFHRDLPYFLHDLRPAGFLGRLVPRQHPELGLPADARLWSQNDVLRYVSRFGWNLPGNLVVGDEALARYLELSAKVVDSVQPGQRKRRYPRLAQEVLLAGVPGSSAAGEQPKFLTVRAPDREVLVKFSSAGRDARSRREADLLVAEHLAHRVLSEHGQEASRSELVASDDQLFLEVERFDRLALGGRRGVISLFALDAEYLGSMKTWSDSVTRLARLGHVPEGSVEATRIRELFGQLIGNTDMHPGNLSFFARGSQVLELAPVYDMLPMLYATSTPLHPGAELQLPPAAPHHVGIWQTASAAALELWSALARESRVSRDFAGVAAANVGRVEAWRRQAQRLPA